MAFSSFGKAILVVAAALALASCGRLGGSLGGSEAAEEQRAALDAQEPQRETIWDLFQNVDDPNVTVEAHFSKTGQSDVRRCDARGGN